MKTDAIMSIKNVISSAMRKSASGRKVAAENTIKDGERLMSAGQDAVAAQNKAMISKVYTKPEMKVNEMNKRELKAASDGYGRPGYDDGYGW